MKFPQQGKECDGFDRAVCGVLHENATSHTGVQYVSSWDCLWMLSYFKLNWLKWSWEGHMSIVSDCQLMKK